MIAPASTDVSAIFLTRSTTIPKFDATSPVNLRSFQLVPNTPLRDGSAGDTWYPFDLSQQGDLVQANKRADVEDHRAIATAGEREPDAVFKLRRRLVEKLVQGHCSLPTASR
jgi:hypothetical protein